MAIYRWIGWDARPNNGVRGAETRVMRHLIANGGHKTICLVVPISNNYYSK